MKLYVSIPLVVMVCAVVFDSASQGVSVTAPAVKFEATSNLTLRDAPPKTWFLIKGEKIGVINAGDQVMATDHKTVKTLYGNYEWLKVQKIDPQTKQPTATGWVYAGEKDGDFYLKKSGGELPLPAQNISPPPPQSGSKASSGLGPRVPDTAPVPGGSEK